MTCTKADKATMSCRALVRWIKTCEFPRRKRLDGRPSQISRFGFPPCWIWTKINHGFKSPSGARVLKVQCNSVQVDWVLIVVGHREKKDDWTNDYETRGYSKGELGRLSAGALQARCSISSGSRRYRTEISGSNGDPDGPQMGPVFAGVGCLLPEAPRLDWLVQGLSSCAPFPSNSSSAMPSTDEHSPCRTDLPVWQFCTPPPALADTLQTDLPRGNGAKGSARTVGRAHTLDGLAQAQLTETGLGDDTRPPPMYVHHRPIFVPT